jgi:hypothetical protein
MIIYQPDVAHRGAWSGDGPTHAARLIFTAGTRLITDQQPGPRELAGDFLDLRAVGRSLHGLQPFSAAALVS